MSEARASPVPGAARELLGGIIDYAGLFPPAGLPMEPAIRNYAAYRRSDEAWALGRLVVPAARLGELADALSTLEDMNPGSAWGVSALIGTDVTGDLGRVAATNQASETAGRGVRVDVLELKAGGKDGIGATLGMIPAGYTSYVEVPTREDPRRLLGVIAERRARAKVRTGGVTPEMFPEPQELLRFLRMCAELDLPFKATAGLHHAVTGRYPLTYEPGSPDASMYGYLNLLTASLLVRRDAGDPLVMAALKEREAQAFGFQDDGFAWREQRFDLEEIRTLRWRFLISFGSCSFGEPMEELPAGRSVADAGASPPTAP